MEGGRQYNEGTERNYAQNQGLLNNQSASNPGGDFFILENSAPARSKKEKALIGAVILVAIITIFVGYNQVFGMMSRPFTEWFLPKNDQQGVSGDTCPSGNCGNTPLAELALLKNKDTDQDGLSDYDELYQYKTSPYLEDSDSDGITDKAEITASTDPNCPTGQNCGTANFSGVYSQASGEADALTQVTANNQFDLIKTIRQSLLDQGVAQEQVDAITDEELLALYEQYTAEMEASQNSGSGAADAGSDFTPANSSQTTGTTGKTLNLAGLTINSIDDLKNLSASQIRQLLVANGAPEDQLKQISDDQLKAFFLQNLESQLQTSPNTNTTP